MKKVLHLITGLKRKGGAEAMILKTLPNLKNTENIVCVLKEKGEMADTLEKRGIKVYDLGMNNIFNFFSGIRRYREIIEDIKPDVQVNYLIHADVFGRFFAKCFGVPKVISYIRNRHIKPIFIFLDRITLGSCDYLLTNSESVLSFYRNNFKFPEDKSSCIPNGVVIPEELPEIDKKSFRKELGLKDDDIVITCVASFIKQKDHETLLLAIKMLKDKGFDNVKLLLIGEGKEKKNIYNLWDELGLKDMVLFLGKRNDVPNILRISDLFVLPSIHEGMSNALLEAMLYEVPSIVSSIPENEELISHNDNGLIFNTQDPESLTENLIKAINGPEEMKRFAKKAKELVKDKYDINKIINKLDYFLCAE